METWRFLQARGRVTLTGSFQRLSLTRADATRVECGMSSSAPRRPPSSEPGRCSGRRPGRQSAPRWGNAEPVGGINFREIPTSQRDAGTPPPDSSLQPSPGSAGNSGEPCI